MAELLAKGMKVKYVQPTYEGEITGLKIIDDEVQYLVAFKDQNGDAHEQYFKASQLEIV